MNPPSRRADLGRMEPWLRALGLFIWMFIGLSRLAPDPAASGGHHATPAWVLPWLVYGVAMVGAGWHRRLPSWARVALLLTQSAAVILFTGRGLRGFEGLLLSIVAVQVPTVLPLTWAVHWTLAQIPVLLAIVFPFKSATEMMEIVGAYSAFSAFALLVYWLHQQESKARWALARAHADLLATRALVLDGARQSERLRISRELHDSLGHNLIAVSLQLELAEQLDSGSAATPISQAKRIAHEAMAEVRRVVAVMQHREALDLIATLKILAAGIPSPRIHIDGDQAAPITDRESSHALFRCAQEAITNSLKHAGAHNIWVVVDQCTEHITVRIRDDGQGVSTLRTGAGLGGIRARIAQLGGRVAFESAAGVGFTVQVTVPLGRAARWSSG